jgi:hypothetical protein
MEEVNDTAKIVLAEVARAKQFMFDGQMNEIFLSCETIISGPASIRTAKSASKRSKKLMRVQLASGDIQDIRTVDLSSCNYYKPLPHERLKNDRVRDT